ncbi:MAG TPA: hypothetical protein DEQ02_01665 [Ruminococcaceae bacterium]|nr:hypothetical protein [Oscillospiraceae bacterium]
MTGLYIALGIIAFFVILLVSPVHMRVSYRGALKITVRYLFVRLNLTKEKLSRTGHKKKPSHTPKPHKKKENKFISDAKDILRDQGLSEFVSYIIEIVKLVFSKSKMILAHTQVRKFYLRIHFSGEDAASTAMEYGILCALIYPALSGVSHMVKLKKYELELIPDFDGAPLEIELDTAASLRPIHALAGLISGVFKFISLLRTGRQTEGGKVK